MSATWSHLQSIGVRELRRDASRWLARVRAGESFLVTDRGRPIARLAPIGPEQGYAALLADGRLTPGSGRPLGDVVAGLDEVAPASGSNLSGALAELRDEER